MKISYREMEELRLEEGFGWHTSQLLQLYTQHKWTDVNILGSSKWQFGVWGLFMKDKLDNCPHWALTLMMEVGRLGKKNLVCIWALVIFFPLLVMSAPSPLADILIYKITAEGFLNYTDHSLSLAVIKQSTPSKSQ